ncbi:MAG: sensor histidine kinase [Christensenellales bacterium]|jgi:two-component system sensor histidine kinase VanS
MNKRKSYFFETIIYQILWIFVSFAIVLVLFIAVDSTVINSINKDLALNKIQTFYFSTGKHLFFIIGIVFVIGGAFMIQKKQYQKYNDYFTFGIRFLNGEIPEIPPFHESLIKERDSFVALRREYLHLEEKYEQAYKEKTDLLTYFAHDIKTPLANILGYVNLLKEENLTIEQQKKFIDVIHRNTEYMNQLTEEFFSYLKFNLHKIPIHKSKINLEIYINQWAEEQSLNLDEKELMIEFNNTKGREIETDPELLLRALNNLLDNAKKYSKEGSTILLNIDIRNQSLRIEFVNLIDSNYNVNWDLVKSKFYRGDMGRNTSKNRGAGLGLPIANDIIAHLGGHFEIKQSHDKVYAKIELPIYE